MHIVKLVFSAFAALAGPRQQGDAHYLVRADGHSAVTHACVCLDSRGRLPLRLC
jgi:hypothetical protein